jgi:large subunit ribosomal protein L6
MASNIGKKTIQVKDGVTIVANGQMVTVSGTKGTLEAKIPVGTSLDITDGVITVKKVNESRELEKFYGLTRAMVNNMVEGVSKGFEKKLELSGVGYRAKVEGRDLVLNVGYANPVKITPPEGIQIGVAENTITVSGINKQIVGDVASNIRKVRVPDPYKAKGIKYVGEHIRRKAGKTAAKGA